MNNFYSTLAAYTISLKLYIGEPYLTLNANALKLLKIKVNATPHIKKGLLRNMLIFSIFKSNKFCIKIAYM